MKLGLVVRNSGPDAARAVATIPRLAEDLGFDSAWVSDHLVVPPSFAERYDAEWLEAVVALTHAAAATARIRLGFSALILPYRPPLLVAKQVEALSLLAPGRVTVAAGSGWLREEFDALGVPFDARGDLTDAAIDAIRRTAEVEILAAGNGRGVLGRAAERCDGWHPIALSPDEVGARRRRLHALAGGRTMRIVVRARVSIRDEPAERPLYGPPEKIRADLMAYASAGVDEMVLDYAARDPDTIVRLIERVAKEVRA